MKILLSSIALLISFGFMATNVFASSSAGASCTVTAEVVDRRIEIRKAYVPDGKVSKERESKVLKLEILKINPSVPGNCDFVNEGSLFETNGGSSPDSLNIGDIIEAGVELASSMSESGAVSFIHWEPISLISSERSLPPAFHLQSSDTPAQNSAANEWQTFQDSRYTFQFEYPAKWSIENQQGTNRVLILKDEQGEEIITIDTGVNLTIIGAYPPNNSREVFKTESGDVLIDWNVDGAAYAMLSAPNGTSGVGVTLHKVNPETKTAFLRILSTFKFLK